MKALALALLLAHVHYMELSFAKGPCSDYFGGIVDDPHALVTVADPDVTQGFPKGSKTFVHHSGETCTFFYVHNVLKHGLFPCIHISFAWLRTVYPGPGSVCISPGPPQGCHR